MDNLLKLLLFLVIVAFIITGVCYWRRNHPIVHSLANVHGGSNLYPLMNPLFNLREVGKQCILLEDHLNQPKKQCHDCIKKHFLHVEGLLEEANSLDI